MRRFRLTGPKPKFAILFACISLGLWWLASGAESYHTRAFLAAVQRGDTRAARTELTHPHDRSYIMAQLDRTGGPQLYQRAMDASVDRGGLDLVRGLMERGAKPSFRHLVTATDYAGYWDADLANLPLYLVEHGAPVRGATGEGNPLSYAMGSRDLRLSRALIERGADLDAANQVYDGSYGFRPLEAAAGAHNLEGVRLLLDHGADPMTISATPSSQGKPTWEEIRRLAQVAQQYPTMPRQAIMIWKLVKPIVEKRLGHRVED